MLCLLQAAPLLAFVGGPITLPRADALALAPALASQAATPPLAALHETLMSTSQRLGQQLKSSAIASSLRRNLPLGLPADDVMLALVSPEAFWLLHQWRRTAFGEQVAMRHVLQSTRAEIRDIIPPRYATVSVRTKGLWSTFHKATVRQKQVHDVLAVRVVVRGDDEDDVYEALQAIRSVYPAVSGRLKDYVRFPKANGYQSLHDTLLLPNGQEFEIQIRTERMHAQAEVGTAAHRRYKQRGPVWLSTQMLSGLASSLASGGTALSLVARLAAATQ